MSSETLKHFFVGVFFVVIQVLIFQHLTVFGAMADPLLIFLLWLIGKYDRTKVILFAAGLGLIQDALFDYWGLFMFSKTLLCFLAYGFLHQRSEIRMLLWQVFLIILVSSLVHNLFFIALSSFVGGYGSGYFTIIFLFGNSLYTAVIGSLFFILKGD